MKWSLPLWLVACSSFNDRDDADKDGVPDSEETDTVPPGAEGAPTRSCESVIRADFAVGTDASVAGSFNGWTPAPMADPEGDGSFEISLGELAPGTYPWKFVYDVQRGNPVWETPPADVYTTFDGGVENRALRVGDCRVPSLRAVSGSASADGELQAVFRFERGVGGGVLDADAVVATVGEREVEAEVNVATGEITVRASSLPRGKHAVRVRAADTSGAEPEEGGAYLPLWVEDEPYDWASGILYYVFTDRFRDGGPDGLPMPTPQAQTGTDFMGGDLVGATEMIESGWFDELGVRSIWLSPVNENPEGAFIGSGGAYYTGYHGYWPTEGRDVEDRLGTTEVPADQALKRFIDAAHAHGIRVLLDTVLNHVHEQHEYIRQNPSWFTAAPCPCSSDAGPCNWDTNPIYCWFTSYLPDLDYKNQEVVDQLLDDARWWVETYDIDGFRVDAAKHMDHVIMRSMALRLNELYEVPAEIEMYQVGETFTFLDNQGLIMQFVADWELDGQFDFPMYYGLRDAATNTRWTEVSEQAHAAQRSYGRFWHRMSPFMGNHDVSRIATDIQGCPTWALFGGCPDVMAASGPISEAQWNVINRMSVIYGVVATMPGVPLLYYGDEIGLAGAGDPDNRRMMKFEGLSPAQTELLGRIQALGRVRNEVPALHTGEWQELWVSGADDLFMYARDNGGGDVALYAARMNWSDGERTWQVPMPTALGVEGARFVDALGGPRTGQVTGGTMSVTLGPWEYAVLVKE